MSDSFATYQLTIFICIAELSLEEPEEKKDEFEFDDVEEAYWVFINNASDRKRRGASSRENRDELHDKGNTTGVRKRRDTSDGKETLKHDSRAREVFTREEEEVFARRMKDYVDGNGKRGPDLRRTEPFGRTHIGKSVREKKEHSGSAHRFRRDRRDAVQKKFSDTRTIKLLMFADRAVIQR